VTLGGLAAAADRAALVSLLNYADGESIDTLRRALRLSQPGGTHAVDRLSRLGLVNRRPSPTDARATALVLTAQGEQQARALLSARGTVMRELLAPLAAEERMGVRGAARGSRVSFDQVDELQVTDGVTVLHAHCLRERLPDAPPQTLPAGRSVLVFVTRRDSDGWHAVAATNVTEAQRPP
jgi:DNA-binding MarR family transcriptional regulator